MSSNSLLQFRIIYCVLQFHCVKCQILSRSAAPYPCTEICISLLSLMRYSHSSNVSLTLILLLNAWTRYPLSLQLDTLCLDTPFCSAISPSDKSQLKYKCVISCCVFVSNGEYKSNKRTNCKSSFTRLSPPSSRLLYLIKIRVSSVFT